MATIYRLKSSKLSSRRVDAWHHQPSFDKEINKIELTLGLAKLSDNINLERGVTGGATPLGANYLDEGNVRFYRTSEIDNLFLDADSAVYISDMDDEKLKRSRLKVNDIILTITGAKFGKSAVVNKKHLPGNISQHSVRFEPNSDIDSYWLVAYLNCKVGQIAIWREAYGATRPAIDYPSIKALVIPKLQEKAQRYIGNKVRQAELFIEWSTSLERLADKLIEDQFIWEYVPTMTSKPRKIEPIFLNPISLGPEFNRAIEGQSLFESSNTLKSYIKSCKCGDPIRSDERVKGRYDYYGASGPIDKHNDFNFNGIYIIVAQDGSIGCASVSEGKIWANNHVWVLSTLENADIDSIARYLNHHFPYWKGITTGSVIPKVTSENLLNLRIPDKVATNNKAGDLLRKTKEARAKSTALTEAAKLLIESLIEGQISVAKLVAAQQALEEGDNSTDKAILNKLTDKGYLAEGGKPLFDDLDKLYELLDEAKVAMDVDGELV
jgi:type I restriction enzyme S subunit